MSDQGAQGRHLVEALTAQLADGQGETLHSLHTAAAAVRRHATQLATVAVEPSREVRVLIADLESAAVNLRQTGTTVVRQVTGALTEEVAARVVALEAQLTRAALETATTSTAGLREQLELEGMRIGGQLAASTAASELRLDATAMRVAQAIETSGTSIIAQIDAVGAAVLIQTSTAVNALEASVQATVDSMTEASAQFTRGAGVALSMLEEHVARTRDLLESAGDAVAVTTQAACTAGAAQLEIAGADVTIRSELASQFLAARVELAATELTAGLSSAVAVAQGSFDRNAATVHRRLTRAQQGMIAVSDATLAGIEFAGNALSSIITESTRELSTEATEFLGALDQLGVEQRQNDERQGLRIEARIQRLIERSDRAVGQLTEQLRREAEKLTVRDEQHEYFRAQEFARVLEDVLSRSGARGRDLRERVVRVLQSDRRERQATVVAAEPTQLTPTVPTPTEPAPTKPALVKPRPTKPTPASLKRPAPAKPRKRVPKKQENST
ncbi:hypothetical protein [Aeromicrobium sp.]|uniref:hypothetical protein n=1 Tax=Aeromicrobium sp. TaxID=1871063 RepID=UPI0019935924|nr:hypothetical protein [Aeromicrobium sp.]MBC7633538.1 hypothetical protein [Aeromicrobium sp.]